MAEISLRLVLGLAGPRNRIRNDKGLALLQNALGFSEIKPIWVKWNRTFLAFVALWKEIAFRFRMKGVSGDGQMAFSAAICPISERFPKVMFRIRGFRLDLATAHHRHPYSPRQPVPAVRLFPVSEDIGQWRS
jgi:hypothetical protein